MPAGRDGVGFGTLVVMGGFLTGLALGVPTVTRFVLWGADELAIPVQSGTVEMCNLPGAETEPAAK